MQRHLSSPLSKRMDQMHTEENQACYLFIVREYCLCFTQSWLIKLRKCHCWLKKSPKELKVKNYRVLLIRKSFLLDLIIYQNPENVASCFFLASLNNGKLSPESLNIALKCVFCLVNPFPTPCLPLVPLPSPLHLSQVWLLTPEQTLLGLWCFLKGHLLYYSTWWKTS